MRTFWGKTVVPGETEKRELAMEPIKYFFSSIWRKFLRKLRKRNGEKRSQENPGQN